MKKKTKQYYRKKKPFVLNSKFNIVGDVVYDDLFGRVCNKKDYYNKETQKLLEEKYR